MDRGIGGTVHEISLAQRIVGIALKVGAEHGGGRIAAVRLLIGMLSGVDPETLRFAFDVVTRGTVAEGCRLSMVRVPTRLKCRACGLEREGDLLEPCGACGTVPAEVLAGRELRVDAIEMDEGPPGESPDVGSRTHRNEA